MTNHVDHIVRHNRMIQTGFRYKDGRVGKHVELNVG